MACARPCSAATACVNETRSTPCCRGSLATTACDVLLTERSHCARPAPSCAQGPLDSVLATRSSNSLPGQPVPIWWLLVIQAVVRVAQEGNRHSKRGWTQPLVEPSGPYSTVRVHTAQYQSRVAARARSAAAPAKRYASRPFGPTICTTRLRTARAAQCTHTVPRADAVPHVLCTRWCISSECAVCSRGGGGRGANC